jgi:hypothetical protein
MVVDGMNGGWVGGWVGATGRAEDPGDNNECNIWRWAIAESGRMLATQAKTPPEGKQHETINEPRCA